MSSNIAVTCSYFLLSRCWTCMNLPYLWVRSVMEENGQRFWPNRHCMWNCSWKPMRISIPRVSWLLRSWQAKKWLCIWFNHQSSIIIIIIIIIIKEFLTSKMCQIIWVFVRNMSVGGKLFTNPTGSAMAVPTSLLRLKMTPRSTYSSSFSH